MMKKNSITINDLAVMISDLATAQQKAYDVLDARLRTLEEGKVVSVKASKPSAQKPKASSADEKASLNAARSILLPHAAGCTTATWVLDKKCVYSAPNTWISKKARYAFKMQSAECGGVALTEEERNALVKKVGDKYITVRKFATEKAAKEFFKKWMEQ